MQVRVVLDILSKSSSSYTSERVVLEIYQSLVVVMIVKESN